MRWPIRLGGARDVRGVLYAGEYNAALTFGDPSGMAYLEVTEPILTAQQLLRARSSIARAAMSARLATVDAADAAAIAATNDTGELRFNGRKYELQAIDALEATVDRSVGRAKRDSRAGQDQRCRVGRGASATSPNCSY